MYIESSTVSINGEEHKIDKYRRDCKLYCYCFHTNQPVNFNGGIGEEKHGVNLVNDECDIKQCEIKECFERR